MNIVQPPHHLVIIPPSVTKMVEEGQFTLDDLIHQEETLTHLSDTDIKDILTLNNAVNFAHKARNRELFVNSYSSSRVNVLSSMVNVDVSRDILFGFVQNPSVKKLIPLDKTPPVDPEIMMIRVKEAYRLQQTTGNVIVLMMTPQSSEFIPNLPYYISKLIADRLGYRLMVNINNGKLYKELLIIINSNLIHTRVV